MGELAPLFESERMEVAAVSKSKVADAPDTLRNGHFLETAAGKTEIPDCLQRRIRFEGDLAQLSTVAERELSELSDCAGNEYLFYVAIDKPFCSHDLESVREAQYLRVLIKAQLLPCHLNVWRKTQVGYLGLPETEPADFLDALVHLELLQITAFSEGHWANFPQRRGRGERLQTRTIKCFALNLHHGRARVEDDLSQILAVRKCPLSDYQPPLAFLAIVVDIAGKMARQRLWPAAQLIYGAAQEAHLRQRTTTER